MTPDRFDELVRSLILARSRRAMLSLFAGGLIALGGAEAMVVEAKKKSKKKRKKKRRKKRKKKCTKQGRVFCKKTCCPPGDVCASGQCVTGQGTCEAGADACAGTGDPFCFDASGEHQCICQTRLEGGTRCSVFGDIGGQCGECETDADCVALGLPPGSSCIDASLGTCVCPEAERGVCVIPCSSNPF